MHIDLQIRDPTGTAYIYSPTGPPTGIDGSMGERKHSNSNSKTKLNFIEIYKDHVYTYPGCPSLLSDEAVQRAWHVVTRIHLRVVLPGALFLILLERL